MSRIKPVVELLDECDWYRLPSGAYKCRRCKDRLTQVPPPGIMCHEGRKHRLGWSFWCPGCDQVHIFYTAQYGRPEKHGNRHLLTWSFNGDVEKPTFNPSLLIPESEIRHRCHLYLHNGVLEFLSDCTHPFKNLKVPIPIRSPLTNE